MNIEKDKKILYKPIFTGIDDTSEQIDGVRVVIWIGIESKVTPDKVRRGHEPLAILLLWSVLQFSFIFYFHSLYVIIVHNDDIIAKP